MTRVLTEVNIFFSPPRLSCSFLLPQFLSEIYYTAVNSDYYFIIIIYFIFIFCTLGISEYLQNTSWLLKDKAQV